MNTFLPYPSFVETARVLDDRRLGKQRIEALQIICVLEDGVGGWADHPATLMWRGFTPLLRFYFDCVSREWESRGFEHTMGYFRQAFPVPVPPWMRDERLHSSHRANLLRKDPAHYGRFNWADDPSLPYYWPVRTGGQKR